MEKDNPLDSLREESLEEAGPSLLRHWLKVERLAETSCWNLKKFHLQYIPSRPAPPFPTCSFCDFFLF